MISSQIISNIETTKNKINLITILGGQLIYCTDTKELFYDSSEKIRIQISDIIYVNTKNELPLLSALTDKLYYVKDTNTLKRYTGTEWVTLNSSVTEEQINLWNNKQDTSDNRLLTEDKTIVGAINDLFTSVSNGKSLLAATITDKGVETAASDKFDKMASNRESIKTGLNVGNYTFTEDTAYYVEKLTCSYNIDYIYYKPGDSAAYIKDIHYSYNDPNIVYYVKQDILDQPIYKLSKILKTVDDTGKISVNEISILNKTLNNVKNFCVDQNNKIYILYSPDNISEYIDCISDDLSTIIWSVKINNITVNNNNTLVPYFKNNIYKIMLFTSYSGISNNIYSVDMINGSTSQLFTNKNITIYEKIYHKTGTRYAYSYNSYIDGKITIIDFDNFTLSNITTDSKISNIVYIIQSFSDPNILYIANHYSSNDTYCLLEYNISTNKVGWNRNYKSVRINGLIVDKNNDIHVLISKTQQKYMTWGDLSKRTWGEIAQLRFKDLGSTDTFGLFCQRLDNLGNILVSDELYNVLVLDNQDIPELEYDINTNSILLANRHSVINIIVNVKNEEDRYCIKVKN